MFSDPNLLGKLAANPRTAKHLSDPAFVQKVRSLSLSDRIHDNTCMRSSNCSNPIPALLASKFIGVQSWRLLISVPSSALQDPRMIEVLGVLMGVDMAATTREEGSNDMPEGFQAPPAASSSPSTTGPSPSTSSQTQSTPAPAPAKEEDVEMEDEEEAKAKKEALAAKATGAAAYKQRDFETAIAEFSKAWEIWPKDITFLTNLSGAHIRSLFSCLLFSSLNSRAFREGRLRQDYRGMRKGCRRGSICTSPYFLATNGV